MLSFLLYLLVATCAFLGVPIFIVWLIFDLGWGLNVLFGSLAGGFLLSLFNLDIPWFLQPKGKKKRKKVADGGK